LPAGTDRHRPNLDANTSDTIANAGPIWPVFSIRRDWKISMNTDSAAVSSIPPPQFPVPHRRSFPKESEHWQRRGRQRPRITTASSCARCRLGEASALKRCLPVEKKTRVSRGARSRVAERVGLNPAHAVRAIALPAQLFTVSWKTVLEMTRCFVAAGRFRAAATLPHQGAV
jgi:hypothetical protein